MPGTRGFFAALLVVGALMVGILLSDVLTPQDVPQEVAAGFALWQEQGCTGCHTLYGQGGAYAPDLTRIFNQRGADYISEFLVDPAAFHPDARVMPRFTLSLSERDELVAMLEWVGGQDAADWSPREIVVNGSGGFGTSVTVAQTTVNSDEDPAVTRGRALFSRSPAICSTCHSLEPDVVVVGPSLYGIADRAWYRVTGLGPEQYIRESILDPSAYIVEGYTDVMQKNFGETLTSQDIADLTAFMMTLQDDPDAEYNFGGARP